MFARIFLAASRWESLRKGVINISNNIEVVEQIQVPILVFERMEHVSNKGKNYIKLTPQNKEFNIRELLLFVSELLPKIIHHSQLKANRVNTK